MHRDKLRKNVLILMAKLWIFLWWIENKLSFSRSSHNDICSRNIQFFILSHEEGWSYCSMLFNEKLILKGID